MSLFVLPHSGLPLAPHDLWWAWTFAPSLLLPLCLAVFVYLLGARNVWRRAGKWHGISRGDTAAFLAAVLALFVALASPLDALSGSLFSAHMVQHLVLTLAAAPLLVMSDFPLALLWALPRGWARATGGYLNQSATLPRVWRAISNPLSAWLLFTIALWLWHAPRLYQAALEDEGIHVFEHFVLLSTAMLFWWVLLTPAGRRGGERQVRYGLAVLYLFTTTLQSGILGALMTFSSQPWYPYYAPLVAPWGLTPLEDQQLAGLIMWMPGGFILTGLTIAYFAAWLRALEKHTELRRNG